MRQALAQVSITSRMSASMSPACSRVRRDTTRNTRSESTRESPGQIESDGERRHQRRSEESPPEDSEERHQRPGELRHDCGDRFFPRAGVAGRSLAFPP